MNMRNLHYVSLCCICTVLAIFVGAVFATFESDNENYELLLVTVATEETDGLKRLIRSANMFGHRLHVFGMDETWNGGDMLHQGGAQKIRVLRQHLDAYKGKDNVIVLFTDAYDVIINSDSETMIRKFFTEFAAQRIVFGAEPFCWPNRKLAQNYPPVIFGERYLNSGMFIGFIGEVLEMLELAKKKNLKDNDDDQLFYTHLYINPEIRKNINMALDSMSYIFQNLNGMYEFVGISTQTNQEGRLLLENSLYNTNPLILHGNGPSKYQLNVLGNYLLKGPSERPIYEAPHDPFVAIAVFILKPIPYIEEFFRSLMQLEYPKEKIFLRIYNNQHYNQLFLGSLVKMHNKSYASMELFDESPRDEHTIRIETSHWADETNASFLFLLDADAHITAPDALLTLILKAKEYENYHALLAPLLLRPATLFSNFWGAVSDSGYYARAFDYVDIIQGKLPGIWNVPFIGSAILVSRRKFFMLPEAYSFNTAVDADLSFAQFCREKGHFMYVDSSQGPEHYGFLVNSEVFSSLPEKAQLNLEIYDYPNNKKLWEQRYIHSEYFSMLKPDVEVPLVCPDVYDFPFLSERFCKEIIEIMENYGGWSEGKHQDRRIQGGYENVPTRDIHMNQVGFDRHWLQIMEDYVVPLQEKVFIGFYQKPIQANMMFVVRYRPDEQASLRPHHDASTYSIDVALNKQGVDYEGGGVRYIRYNCTVAADRIGWSMLFPGRLTHLHEGLPTTRGTRYILVSFINP